MGEQDAARGSAMIKADMVNAPAHYTRTERLYGLEVYQLIGHLDGFLFNAMKYLFRAGEKGNNYQFVEDLKKALWYLNKHRTFLLGDEISPLRRVPVGTSPWTDRVLGCTSRSLSKIKEAVSQGDVLLRIKLDQIAFELLLAVTTSAETASDWSWSFAIVEREIKSTLAYLEEGGPIV